MKDGKKKPLYKRWWVWIIAVFVIVAASGGESDEKNTLSNSGKDTKNIVSDNTINNEEKETTEEPVKKTVEDPVVEKPKAIKSGTYKIGVDLEPGEYLFMAKNMGYIEASRDSTGTLGSIIFNDNVKGHSYLTVNEGEYLKITGGEMYPVANAPSVIPKDGTYKDGMYKVGQDIPAGEYKVILTNSSMGYYEVSSDSRHDLYSIITNENVQGDTYLTVQDGQYLKISGLQIKK